MLLYHVYKIMCTFALVMNRIKEVIKEQGLTIKSVADKMGIARESLSRMIVSPSTPTLEKLSEVLNVPIWQLFATKEEIVGQSGNSGQTIICPKCGEVIKIKTDIVK